MTKKAKEKMARIIKKIEKLWNKFPEFRFGQLITAISVNDTDKLFNMEDEEFEKMIDDMFVNM